MHKHAPGLNLNTVLITVLLALSSWSLRTLVEMGTVLATITEKVSQHERDILDLRSRVNTGEREVLRTRFSPARPPG